MPASMAKLLIFHPVLPLAFFLIGETIKQSVLLLNELSSSCNACRCDGTITFIFF
jgi:hypothetical protein